MFTHYFLISSGDYVTYVAYICSIVAYILLSYFSILNYKETVNERTIKIKEV